MMLRYRLIAGFILMCCLSQVSRAQTINSSSSGLWDVATNWGGTVPTSAGADFVVIQSTHVITIPSGVNAVIDNLTLNGDLIIESGGSLQIDNGGAADPDLTFSGGKITVRSGGTFKLGNGTTHTGSSISSFIIEGGGTYQHLFTTTEGVIPTADWSPSSTLRISGYTPGSLSLTSSSWGQTFGNVTYDATGGVNFQGRLTNVVGTFTVSSGSVTVTNSLATNTTYSFGNVVVSGTGVVFFSTFLAVPGVTGIMDVAGNFTYTSTGTSTLTNNGIVELHVGGDFAMSSGTLRLLTATGARGSLYLNGNMSFTGGNITETASGATFGEIVFDGSSPQTYTRTSGSYSSSPTINFVVNANATVNMGTSTIDGLGSLNVSGTLGVGDTNLNGAIQSGIAAGNIRVSGSRIFNSGSVVNYNGSGTQYISSSHPAIAHTQVTVGTLRTVTGQNVTINGDLELLSGNLQLMSNSGLILGGSLTAHTNRFIISATSDLTINGTADYGVIPFQSGSQTFRNLTINRSGVVELAVPVQLNGALTLTQGSLLVSSSFTLNGTASHTAGYLQSDGSTDLSITGTGALGAIIFEPGFDQINSITINRSGGTATIDGTVTINSLVNLTAGTLINNGTMDLIGGVVITRNSAGQLNGNRFNVTSGSPVNLTYVGGAMNTGFEIPLGVDVLGNLVIDGGPVTLTESISVYNDVTLQSGSLNDGGQTISMYGPNWLDDDGDFVPASGAIDFYGTTTIGGSSVPQFPTITLISGSEVTFPGGTINIAGDISVDIGALADVSSTDISLNGGSLQTLSFNGLTVNNLSIDKTSSSDVLLTSPMLLSGGLTINSTSDFDSNGQLTLLSTSDSGTGDAYIAALPVGASVSGIVTAQRYMSGEGRLYRYVSSPVSGATVADLKDDVPVTGVFVDPSTGTGIISVNPSLYYYDESVSGAMNLGYQAYPATGLASENDLLPGVGYALFVREGALSTVIDLPGTVNQGDIDLNVTYSNAVTPDDPNDGWNLVGNPYPCAIQWSTGWTKTNIAAGVYVRDNSPTGPVSNFLVWDGTIGDPIDAIAPGQAFWVKATDVNPQLIISESAKVTTGGEFFRANTVQVDHLKLIMRSATLGDNAYIRQRDGALAGLDGMDMPKLSNDYFNMAVKAGTQKVAISAVPEFNCSQVFELDMQFVKQANGSYLKNPNGTYSLSVETFGKLEQATLLLTDNYTGQTYQLSQQNPYSFTINSAIPATIAANRFSFRLEDNSTFESLDAALAQVVCPGQPVQLSLSGTIPGVDYRVLNQSGLEVAKFRADSTHQQVEVLVANVSPGDYTWQIQQQSLCQTTDVAQVLVPFGNASSVKSVNASVVCSGGNSNVQAFGASASESYVWFQQGIQLAETSGSLVVPNVSSNTQLEVAIRSAAGCQSERKAVTIEVVQPPVPEIRTEEGKLVSNYEAGNFWFLDGLLIDSASSITWSASGTYRLEVRNAGCSSQVEEILNFTGIQEGPDMLSAYPNPFTNRLTVTGFTGELQSWTILDARGTKLPVTVSNSDTQSIEFDTTNWKSGVYIIRLTTSTGTKSLKAIRL